MFHAPSFGEEDYDFLQDKSVLNLKPSVSDDFTAVISSFANTGGFTDTFNINLERTGDFGQQQQQQQKQQQPLQSQQHQLVRQQPQPVFTSVNQSTFQFNNNTVNLQQNGCHQHQQNLNQQFPQQVYHTKSSLPQNQRVFTMASQRDSIFESLENIAPKFPPQDVDLPDISSSGGMVPSSASLISSGFSAAGLYGQSDSNSMPRTHPDIGMHISSPVSLSDQQLGMNRVSPTTSSASNMSNASPPTESSEDSDDSVPLAQLVKRQAEDDAPTPPQKLSPKSGGGIKKPRLQKKKKKKDPNEPQKPVSAYALFFRDTQAAIKGQNPNATFGEVSKIVASMWEGLDPEHKNVYKKKTELAKKEYLKQLAAYRASLVSQTRLEDSPSPPHRSPTGTSPQHMMGYMSNISPQHMGSPAHMMSSPTHMGSPAHMGSPTQMISQSPQHISSPHHIPSPQHVSSPQHMMGVTSQSHHSMYGAQSPPQYNMGGYNNDMGSSNGMLYDSQPLPPSGGNAGRMLPGGMCIRTGCGNRAIDNIGWDSEYCSNECVVSHCRDVFTAWVANRHVPNNAFTVK